MPFTGLSREFTLTLFTEYIYVDRGFRGAIEHFTRLGYPVPQSANAADHFISLLTEQASASDEGGKNKVQSILDAWEADGASLPGALMESSSSKREVAAPASQSTESDVVPGFALGFFEELWWLTRRYVTFLSTLTGVIA